MAKTFEERIADVEARLRGDRDADPVDLNALPLLQLYNNLEFNWRPEAIQLLQPKSVTHQEIGVLPGCRLFLNNAQTCNNNAFTVVPYDTPQYDFPGSPAMADYVNRRILIQVPGVYVCTAGVQTDATGAAYNMAFAINWDSVNVAAGPVSLGYQEMIVAAGVGTNPAMNVASMMDMAIGDTLQALVYQNSGALRTIDPGQHVHLAAHWLGTGRSAT